MTLAAVKRDCQRMVRALYGKRSGANAMVFSDSCAWVQLFVPGVQFDQVEAKTEIAAWRKMLARLRRRVRSAARLLRKASERELDQRPPPPRTSQALPPQRLIDSSLASRHPSHRGSN